jgi:thiol:disulfide interchange protein
MRVASGLLMSGTLLAFGAALAGSAEPGPGKPAIQWQTDLHAAHRLAVKQNKPMLLVFGADWCGYCKKMERTTLADPRMLRYINATFVPVHLDADKDKKVASILEVEALPCTIVLSPEADLLGRIVGFEEPEGLYKKLSEAKELQTRISQASGEGRQ